GSLGSASGSGRNRPALPVVEPVPARVDVGIHAGVPAKGGPGVAGGEADAVLGELHSERGRGGGICGGSGRPGRAPGRPSGHRRRPARGRGGIGEGWWAKPPAVWPPRGGVLLV